MRARHFSIRSWALAPLLFVLAAAALSPATACALDAAAPPPPAGELLRQAVANELAQANRGYFAWTDRVQKPRGSVTKLMVATPEGILARTVAINDRALSDEERRQDEERTRRLLDPAAMREKAKKQREDEQHIERILRALPDAFQCSYAESPAAPTLRLQCEPNPSFSPPNYESQVLVGMKTEILIDRDATRIASVRGTLFRDVTFGWGFVARLNRGGRIEISQAKVAGGHWGITHLQMSFDGHLLVLKPLHLEESESSWNYRAVHGMSVAEALEFLRNEPAATAQAAVR